jgi:hypothetical protein
MTGPDVAEPELTPTEARQGKKGWPVLYVLIGGLALAIIAMVVLVGGTDVKNPPPDIGVGTPSTTETPAPAR